MLFTVPEVKKSCFCCPLRWGIIIFGYLNVILSFLAVVFLVLMTELQKTVREDSLIVNASTVLFCIFGMGVILNVLLLVAGYQKDMSMLRLYNIYAIATALAALVPTMILLSRLQVLKVSPALFALVMQCYVIVLVRSEIVKLEQKAMQSNEDDLECTDQAIDVPDSDTLL